MQLIKNHSYIQGFEDYGIVTLADSCLTSTWGFYIPRNFDSNTGSFIINDNLPVRIYNEPTQCNWIDFVRFEPSLVSNHKELLASAKKMFIHPSCKLSRSLVAEKYKKSLNPFLSDAVVIPKPDYDEFELYQDALFINERAKIIVKIRIDTDDAKNIIQSVQEGETFRSILKSSPDDHYGDKKPYNTEDMLDAELFYYGEVLYVPNSQSWATEILTRSIPADKIVFEDSVQESLSCETNQLDLDSLTSIRDMLDSTDDNTVAAGLKSLSMMDWMHYPNSVRYILRRCDTWRWKYNKAANSTSVKYMMNMLSNSRARRYWPGPMDKEIFEQDFELFKQLMMYYEKIDEREVYEQIKMQDFMSVDAQGFLSPRFRKSVA